MLDPKALDMQPHPEGGWYRETWRHGTTVETDRGARALATCVASLVACVVSPGFDFADFTLAEPAG